MLDYISFLKLWIKALFIGTIQTASYIGFSFLTLLVPILLIIAYLTLVERKVIGASQRRMGPNTVGFLGLTQPIADGLKLFFKETIIPSNANTVIFLFTPVAVFFLVY